MARQRFPGSSSLSSESLWPPSLSSALLLAVLPPTQPVLVDSSPTCVTLETHPPAGVAVSQVEIQLRNLSRSQEGGIQEWQSKTFGLDEFPYIITDLAPCQDYIARARVLAGTEWSAVSSQSAVFTLSRRL